MTFNGQLEIDSARGVIYFHSGASGATLLRICGLPTPVPFDQLDITHMSGCNWNGVAQGNDARLRALLGEARDFVHDLLVNYDEIYPGMDACCQTLLDKIEAQCRRHER